MIRLLIYIYSLASSQLRLLFHSPNLQLRRILLQHSLIMVFPELLRGVLPRYALEDLAAAGVFVYEAGNVVDVLVDYYVHAA